MNAEREAAESDKPERIAAGIDPLLVTAYRLGRREPEPELPDLNRAEEYLTPEDRQALDALVSDLGTQIVFRQLQETNRERYSTTLRGEQPPTAEPAGAAATANRELLERYDAIIKDKHVTWLSEYRLTRRLGAGGQGVVYLTEIRGFDEFAFPVAMKIFSPERYLDVREYEETMRRIARVSSRVAQIHHENLLDVQNFLQRDSIRLMIMEFVDGYDLRHLLVPSLLSGVRNRVSGRRWEYINSVIVTEGPEQPRLKAGVAVDIIRDCLPALAALHRADIVHGDIKPSNLMLKRTGMPRSSTWDRLSSGVPRPSDSISRRPMRHPRSWNVAFALRRAIWPASGMCSWNSFRDGPCSPTRSPIASCSKSSGPCRGVWTRSSPRKSGGATC